MTCAMTCLPILTLDVFTYAHCQIVTVCVCAYTDVDQQERMEHWYMVLPYVKTVMFLLLALSDLIAALCLHCAGNIAYIYAPSISKMALRPSRQHYDVAKTI